MIFFEEDFEEGDGSGGSNGDDDSMFKLSFALRLV
jgi:hypothetical protein